MKINWKRVGVWCLVGALGLAAAGGVGAAAWMHGRLKECEKALAAARDGKAKDADVGSGGLGATALPGGSRSVATADGGGVGHAALPGGTNAVVKADAQERIPPAAAKKEEPAKAEERKLLAVAGHTYEGDDELELCFTQRPDMRTIAEYVSVAPMKGALTFEYDDTDGYCCKVRSYDRNQRHHHVKVKGDFLFRTNLTLRVRKGLAVAKNVAGGDSLANDYVRTLQRKDAPPRVVFLDPGRYLPPGGARMLALDSINVAKVHCAAAAIPAANIVQLLARENDEYKRIYVSTRGHDPSDVDTEATESLADKMKEWDVETLGKVNEHQVTPFALRTLPDAASNGVFLVAVRSADIDRKDENWWWSDERGKWNPNRYRLVCVTDIGLTVRHDGNRLQVWATSLMTGASVTNCTIDVYGSNNRQLAKGTTDSTGLCKLVCSERGEPFAVIARTADGQDTSFVCLRDRQAIPEEKTNGSREDFLKPNEVQAFVWTERGIYRHNEKIFVHALLRNGQRTAPKPFPVEFVLRDPEENQVAVKSVISDEFGGVWCDDFSVPAERPSGRWKLGVRIPGKNGRMLGAKEVSIEEFAPPQIRVSVDAKGDAATNFNFTVKAEHLYGGPARNLRSQGAVVFQDAPFEPKGWNGWRFGDDRQGLRPCYRRLGKGVLNEKGECVFQAPLLKESGQPKAAVVAIGEGTVFEAGGRPARARGKRLLHHYPFYIGSTLGGNVRLPNEGFAKVKVACVKPDGKRLDQPRKLKVAFERVDNYYSCKEDRRGWVTWHCERVNVPAACDVKEIETKANGDVELAIPFRADGDYVVILQDAESEVSYSRSFWLGSRGDDEVRASLASPAEVTLTPDKEFYRPGEKPRLLVKSPFAGWALLTAMREKVVYTRVLKLEGPTQEIALDPVVADWAPNLNVALSVVQSADNGGRHQTARAHGSTTVAVRPWENEVPVTLKTAYQTGADEGGTLTVDVAAKGNSSTGSVAVVTVVDEGIHLLTGWNKLCPVAWLARPRSDDLPLYDLFDNLLPVWDGDPLKTRGVKTGGDMGAEMLGRVSPVPTRRFKPLARWQTNVPLTNGTGRAVFKLPEFVGEVRVAAVAFSRTAAGAADIRQKVTPKLVMQPDAPRFAAPGDEFEASVTLANRSGAAGAVKWQVAAAGGVELAAAAGAEEKMDNDGAATRTFRVKAKAVPGEGVLTFTAEGLGEKHVQTIELPVRPAVASRETAGTIQLDPGASRTFTVSPEGAVPDAAVRRFVPSGSELLKLVGALNYLAEYPHGCLEQTTSRIYPLVAANGFLNRLAPAVDGGKSAADWSECINAGVRRVVSMIRANDFVMWPDCNYPPWDRDVSIYAAQFLLEAEKAGAPLDRKAKEQVLKFLRRWSCDNDFSVAAYACQALALAGEPAMDRMLVVYDARVGLSTVAAAQLARAFACTGDRERARVLLQSAAVRPETVKQTATVVLALLELDPADERLPKLVRQLEATRDAARFCWGTTADNAHALFALGAYYRHHPSVEGKPMLSLRKGNDAEHELPLKRGETVKGAESVTVKNTGTGTAWLAWRSLELPKPETVTNETCHIGIERRFLTPEGAPVNMDKLERGDLLTVEIKLSTPVTRTFNDLVIQDLFPAGCEPVLGGIASMGMGNENAEWVMRHDARDDRMLVFSKKFLLQSDKPVCFRYPLRVVSAGSFVLPGTAVEAMYAPEIHANLAPSRVVIAK